MHSEDEPHRLTEVVVDSASETDGFDDRAEIVVEDNDRGGLARHVRSAATHSNTDMRRLQRGRVVDAVPGHGHDLTIRLQRVDDAELLLRHDPRENGRG